MGDFIQYHEVKNTVVKYNVSLLTRLVLHKVN